MGKKNKRSKSAPPAKGKHDKDVNKKKKRANSLTLEAVEAISSSDEGSVDQSNKSWNEKAEALKKKITERAFDKIIAKDDDKIQESDEDDESIEEVVLGSEDSEEEQNDNKEEQNSEDEDSEEDINQENRKSEMKQAPKDTKDESPIDNDSDSSDKASDDKDEDNQKEQNEDSEDEENESQSETHLFDTNSKALLAKTEELLGQKKGLPWAETFDIVPSTPLPFGTKDAETGTTIDVHDDLKREVAFYDIAMEAVEMARNECKKIGIPFSRPEDFFAEMVKSDGELVYKNYCVNTLCEACHVVLSCFLTSCFLLC